LEYGEIFWTRFNAPKNDQLWFYREFCNIMQRKLPSHPLTERVTSSIDKLEQITRVTQDVF